MHHNSARYTGILLDMESTTRGAQDMKAYELADGRVIIEYGADLLPEVTAYNAPDGALPVVELYPEYIELPSQTTYEPESIDMPSDLELSAIYGG
jgi:hypothetical protein